MSKKPLIVIAIIVVAFLVIGGVVLALNSNSDSDTDTPPASADTTTPPATTTPDTGTDTTTPAAKTVTMTFTNGTFSPASVTLNVGDTLVVKNADGSLDFDSDPHPVHTDNPELNLGDIEDGSSKSVVVKNKGTWGVHNHEDPTNTATVIVQ